MIKSSKSIVVSKGSGDLVLKEYEIRALAEDEVLVEVHASSINPIDWKLYAVLRFFYRLLWFLPDLPQGRDLSGVILEVGEAVKNFKVGDQVFAMSRKMGAFGQYTIIDQRKLALKPEHLSHVEAASMPLAALTALQAFEQTHLKPGNSVLIIGGSGGVGVFAIQIAKQMGARVTTVCSTGNMELVKQLGAHQIIDYKHEDFHKLPRQFDVVFDVVGLETRGTCLNLIKPGGRFITTLGTHKDIFHNILSKILKRFSADAVSSSIIWTNSNGADLTKLADFTREGVLKPVIDKTFSLEEIKDAIEYSKLGRTRGKIAITIR